MVSSKRMDYYKKVSENMMDQKCINSIVECIMQSDMSDIDFREVKIRPVRYKLDEEGNEVAMVYDSFCDTLLEKSAMSDAWVAGNLLLFTVFDGYLENKYQLIEGESFRKHYEALPENTSMEKIVKNCYRIMKIIRNGIQHNMSNVNCNSDNYDINYYHRSVSYILKISRNGIKYLYTIIMNTILEQIMGISTKYMTTGHFEGIIYSWYTEMLNEITQFSDDINTELLIVPNELKIRSTVRYPIENPHVVAEDETTITFSHMENNMVPDENNNQYYYSQDYTYKDYLLPQEIGVITWGEGETFSERIKEAKICFYKKNLEEKWKMKSL